MTKKEKGKNDQEDFINIFILGLIVTVFPSSVLADNHGESFYVKKNQAALPPQQRFLHKAFRTYQGEKAYVVNVFGRYHYGGYVPLEGKYSGFYFYEGPAPLIGINPYQHQPLQ